MIDGMPRKRLLPAVIAALALAAAASAGGSAPRAASVMLDAPVLHLAADGHGVAVHTHVANGCDTILLWLPPASPRKIASQNCQQGSTGNGVTSLALHGLRPAWVGYAGGNYREFSVSTTLAGHATPVSFRPVLVENSGAVRWRVTPGSGVLAFEQNGALWRIVPGSKGTCPYSYLAKVCVRVPATGTLLGVGGGRLLIRTPAGVSLIRQDGTVVKSYPDAPEAVTDGRRVVTSTSISLPARAHLAGTARGIVAYTSGGRTYVARLGSTKTRVFPGSAAALSEFGLFTATGKRLTFTPLATLGL